MYRATFALIALAVTGTVAAVAPTGPPRVFQGSDLFNIQCVSDPQIRPDGRQIAYVRVSFDVQTDSPRSSLWLVDTDTGEQTPLATGAASSSSPRWSPDGQRLAYIARDENGHAQIYVRWMKAQQSTRITDLTQAPRNLAWSPDGRSIAFLQFAPEEKSPLGSVLPKPAGANWAEPPVVITDLKYRSDAQGYLRPGYTHVFVVSAEGGFPAPAHLRDLQRGGAAVVDARWAVCFVQRKPRCRLATRSEYLTDLPGRPRRRSYDGVNAAGGSGQRSGRLTGR